MTFETYTIENEISTAFANLKTSVLSLLRSPPLYKVKITNSQKISVLEHEMNQTGFFINVQELILIIYLDFKG